MPTATPPPVILCNSLQAWREHYWSVENEAANSFDKATNGIEDGHLFAGDRAAFHDDEASLRRTIELFLGASAAPLTLPNAQTGLPEEPLSSIRFIAEPAWTLQDFQNQCLDDRRTLGAIVIDDIQNDSGQFNDVALTRSYTHLLSDVFLATCDWDSSDAEASKLLAPTDPLFTKRQAQNQHKFLSGTYSKQEQVLRSAIRASGRNPLDDHKDYSSVTVAATVNGQQLSYNESPPNTSIQHTTSIASGSTTVPAITIHWVSHQPVPGSNAQASIPFLTIAGVGTYLATQVASVTRVLSQTITTNTPTGSIQNVSSAQKQTNAAGDSLGLALAGGSLAQLSSLSIPGTNATAILKNAAADIATSVASRLQRVCFDPSDGPAFESCRRFFAFRPPRVCDRADVTLYWFYSKDSNDLLEKHRNKLCFPLGLVPVHLDQAQKEIRLPDDP
jgi:hypothetical protein